MRLKTKNLIELFVLAGAIAGSLFYQPYIASERNDIPTTGSLPPAELRHLDSEVKNLLRKWGVPGAALAIVKDDKVVFARGYGWSDVEQHKPVESDRSLFRIASVSKPITAAAVLKLADEGKINLDDGAFKLLDMNTPAAADRRVSGITVRQLLDMTAGWDKERSGDPILQPYIRRAARRQHMSGPADFDATMHYVLARRLDYNPGARFAYSNFTYGVLGKVIEKVSGTDYETFVRDNLFAPCGVQLYRAHTREEDRLPNEVKYYAPLEPVAHGLLRGQHRKVPAPYGRAYMEADLPMIGWVATAPELATLFDHVLADERLLSPEIRQQMTQVPSCWHSKRKYFAMGWEIADDNGQKTFYKDGTLPGTRAFVQRTADGITWVALFNGRPPQKKSDQFADQVKGIVSQGLDALPERRARRQMERTTGNRVVPYKLTEGDYWMVRNFNLEFWRRYQRRCRMTSLAKNTQGRS